MHWISRILLMTLLVGLAVAQSRKTEVDRIFAGFNTHTPGCAVGVAQAGQVVLTAGYGMADLERGVPVGPGTLFESGSVAKQFTAATLLLLAQRGVISLDDRLSKYLPELQGGPATVTVRQVMHHISGLREWRPVAIFSGRAEESTVLRNEDLLELAARQKALNFDPGSQYSYSNTGYNIATILIERALGGKKTFQAYTQEAIFGPLGMSTTQWRDNFRAIVPGRALAYRNVAGGYEQLTPIGNLIGAGGLLTTVEDLLKWNENFTHGKVGGMALVAEQEKTAVLNNGTKIPYAAGLGVATVDGLREVAHSGATAGYRTWLGRYPERQLSVAVLCNGSSIVPTTLGRRVARLWTGAKDAPPATPVSVSTEALEKLTGMYRSARSQMVVELKVREQKLYAGNVPWLPVGENEFAVGPTRIVVKGGQYRSVGPDGEDVYERVEPVQPSEAVLAEYAGAYTSDEVAAVTQVWLEKGTLKMKVANTSHAMELKPTFRDGFRSEEGAIVFLREGGKVTGLRFGDGRVWDLRLKRVTR